jgi:hypothetical protein
VPLPEISPLLKIETTLITQNWIVQFLSVGIGQEAARVAPLSFPFGGMRDRLCRCKQTNKQRARFWICLQSGHFV